MLMSGPATSAWLMQSKSNNPCLLKDILQDNTMHLQATKLVGHKMPMTTVCWLCMYRTSENVPVDFPMVWHHNIILV